MHADMEGRLLFFTGFVISGGSCVGLVFLSAEWPPSLALGVLLMLFFVIGVCLILAYWPGHDPDHDPTSTR